MTRSEMEKKNEIIIQKLSNILDELEFLNYNCPHTIGLIDCDTDFDCVKCWIDALRVREKEKMNTGKRS